MALFGFTRLSATPTSPTSNLTIQVEDTSEWPTAPFTLLIRRPNVRPRGSTCEAVTVSTYTGGGTVTLSARAILAGGTQTIALALRKGYECYPFADTSLSDSLHPVDGVSYTRNRAGLSAAMNAVYGAGKGEVWVPPGTDITWDSHTFTITLGAPGVVTWAGHLLLADVNSVIIKTTGVLPTGLTDGGRYYPVNIAANTFSLAATPNGTPITTTVGQSGVHTMVPEISFSGNKCWLDWHPSVTLNKTADAITYTPIRFVGPGTVAATAKALKSNCAEGLPYAIVSQANIQAMVSAGAADGDILIVSQTLTDLGDAGSDAYCARITLLDDAAEKVWLSEPMPKAFATASSAACAKLSCGKDNRITGLRGYGNGNTGIGGLIQYGYQDGLSWDNLSGIDINGPIIYGFDYSYGTRAGSVKGERCGNTSGLHAVEIILNSGASQEGAFHVEDSPFGIEIKGSSWSNWSNQRSGRAGARSIKWHHSRHCTVDQLQSHNSAANSGFTLSGDSGRNLIGKAQSSGNFEPGFLITQVPGGTNVVKDNSILQLDAHNNNLQASEINLSIGTSQGPDNHFDMCDSGGSGAVALTGQGNSVGDSFWVPITASGSIFTAASGSWTVADADIIAMSWRQRGKTMTVSAILQDTTVSATPASLRILIPNTRTAKRDIVGPVTYCDDNGTIREAFVRAIAGDTKLYIFLKTFANFAAAADATDIHFTITFEVQ